MAPPPPSSFAALGLLIAMGTLWGLQFAMLKLAAEGGESELTLLMLALLLLSAAFLAILLARGEAFRPDRACLRFLLVTGLLGYVFPLLATLHAAPHLPAGLLSLIGCLTPVATVIIALGLRTEAVTLYRRLAMLFGCLAIALVLWPEIELPGQGKAPWMLVALVLPLCYGVESIYIAARWPKGLTSLQVVTGETLAATVLVLPLTLIYEQRLLPDLSETQAIIALSIFVGAGVFESLIYFYLIRRTGGVLVSFATFVSLFAGLAWGMVIFAESHGPAIWAAVVLLCLALYLLWRDRSGPGGETAKPGAG